MKIKLLYQNNILCVLVAKYDEFVTYNKCCMLEINIKLQHTFDLYSLMTHTFLSTYYQVTSIFEGYPIYTL